MARNSSAKGKAQNAAAADGKKRKRDGTSNEQPVTGRKRKKGPTSTETVPPKTTVCQEAVINDEIIKDFRITFHSQKFRPNHPGNVPLEHRSKFEHIQQLGQLTYDSYAYQPRPDSSNRPWELENQLRARRLSQKVASTPTCLVVPSPNML
jgi:hypothetical protein